MLEFSSLYPHTIRTIHSIHSSNSSSSNATTEQKKNICIWIYRSVLWISQQWTSERIFCVCMTKTVSVMIFSVMLTPKNSHNFFTSHYLFWLEAPPFSSAQSLNFYPIHIQKFLPYRPLTLALIFSSPYQFSEFCCSCCCCSCFFAIHSPSSFHLNFHEPAIQPTNQPASHSILQMLFCVYGIIRIIVRCRWFFSIFSLYYCMFI